MKYSIEISDGEVIEKFDFKGKEYTKTWEKTQKGFKYKDKRFDKQIEADGYDDNDILDLIYNTIDNSYNYNVPDFWELYMEVGDN